MLPADAPALAALFRASIEVLAEEDYDAAQCAAWMAAAADEAAFGRRLQSSLTLVATHGGAAVGFVSLKGTDHIDMLYVHPEHARQGVASQLVEAVEKLAAARGVTTLTTDASDTARPFFTARSFEPRYRRTVVFGDQWLGSTRMEKALRNGGARASSQTPEHYA